MTAAAMNIWDVYWGLRVEQCPCDVHFVEWLEELGLTGKRVYHFGTGGHHCWVCCNCGLDKTSWGCENYSKKACRQCKKVPCQRDRVRTACFSVAKLLDA